jgi:hypothetical protein
LLLLLDTVFEAAQKFAKRLTGFLGSHVLKALERLAERLTEPLKLRAHLSLLAPTIDVRHDENRPRMPNTA